MSAEDSSPATETLTESWSELVTGVRRGQQRLPRGYCLGHPQDILESIAGALWLELEDHPGSEGAIQACLRRVLYQEFEREWRHPSHSFELLSGLLVSPSPANHSAIALDIPPHLLDWAERYLHEGGPRGQLNRGAQICGSRRLTRLLNTALVSCLTSEQFQIDLKRRTARLLSAVAVDGASARHRQSARDIKVVLRMLTPTSERIALLEAISSIAGPQKPAGRAGR